MSKKDIKFIEKLAEEYLDYKKLKKVYSPGCEIIIQNIINSDQIAIDQDNSNLRIKLDEFFNNYIKEFENKLKNIDITFKNED